MKQKYLNVSLKYQYLVLYRKLEHTNIHQPVVCKSHGPARVERAGHCRHAERAGHYRHAERGACTQRGTLSVETLPRGPGRPDQHR